MLGIVENCPKTLKKYFYFKFLKSTFLESQSQSVTVPEDRELGLFLGSFHSLLVGLRLVCSFLRKCLFSLRFVKLSLQTHVPDLFDNEECLLLYDLNNTKNVVTLYRKYSAFNLNNLGDYECISEFRFHKNDIYRLLNILQLPQEIRFYTG